MEQTSSVPHYNSRQTEKSDYEPEKSRKWLKILIVIAVVVIILIWINFKPYQLKLLYEDALCYLDEDYSTDVSPISEPRRTLAQNAELASRYVNIKGIQKEYDFLFLSFSVDFYEAEKGNSACLLNSVRAYEFFLGKEKLSDVYPDWITNTWKKGI